MSLVDKLIPVEILRHYAKLGKSIRRVELDDENLQVFLRHEDGSEVWTYNNYEWEWRCSSF